MWALPVLSVATAALLYLEVPFQPWIQRLLVAAWSITLLLNAARWLVKRNGARAPQQFAGKHVFITGGSQGLGRALALRFAEMGSNVTIVARTESTLNAVKAEIEKHQAGHPQARALAISADVTRYDSIAAAVQRAEQQFGPCDVLIPCAGASHPGYFEMLDPRAMESEVVRNYLGVMYTVRAAVPSMIARRQGWIGFVSSLASVFSFIGYSNYAATKMAVRGLADGLRNELLPHNIGVSLFVPGNIDTEGFANEQRLKPRETKEIEGAESAIPPEKAADYFIQGLKNGNYFITDSFFPGEVLRGLAHGLTPRDRPVLDLLLAPLFVFLGNLLVYLVLDRPVLTMADATNAEKKRHAEAAAAVQHRTETHQEHAPLHGQATTAVSTTTTGGAGKEEVPGTTATRRGGAAGRSK